MLGDYGLLSPEDMRADLNELFYTLEITHPDLYAHRTKVEVDLERQHIYDDLDRPMTLVSYYLQVAPLIASLGDSHTAVYLPMDAIDVNELFFPLIVEYKGQQAFIVANIGYADIQPGAELLKINDIPISTILNDLPSVSFFSDFMMSLWFLYGSIPEYQLELLNPGAEIPVTYPVYGVTLELLTQRITESLDYSPPERLAYSTIPGENIGTLTINSFGGNMGQYLQPAFTQIQEDGVQHLIIDIRSNTGGMYDQVDLVMKYLTNQPYRGCSIRYARYVVDISASPQEIECDLIQPLDIPLRFQGKLYLLIGPDTYSAAITFATILQDYDLAILIGEETITPASYCGYVSDPVALPRTHLLYQCPASCYIRPNGLYDDRGVIPDVVIETTFQDRIDGRDPVLAYTLDMIRSSPPTP
jgi:C-terminal processing protease CtpA/Prc